MNNIEKQAFEAKLEITLRPLLEQNPEEVMNYVATHGDGNISNAIHRVRLAGMLLPEFSDQLEDFEKAITYLDDLKKDQLLGPPVPELSSEAIAEIHARLKSTPWIDRSRRDKRDPYQWVQDHLAPWIGKGLMQSHLVVDPELYKVFNQQYLRDSSVPKTLDVPPEKLVILRNISDPIARLQIVAERYAHARVTRNRRAKEKNAVTL